MLEYPKCLLLINARQFAPGKNATTLLKIRFKVRYVREKIVVCLIVPRYGVDYVILFLKTFRCPREYASVATLEGVAGYYAGAWAKGTAASPGTGTGERSGSSDAPGTSRARRVRPFGSIFTSSRDLVSPLAVS